MSTATQDPKQKEVKRAPMMVSLAFHQMVKSEAEKRGMTMKTFLDRYGHRIVAD